MLSAEAKSSWAMIVRFVTMPFLKFQAVITVVSRSEITAWLVLATGCRGQAVSRSVMT
ncbi:hypothetical protein D9M72_492590 [compost metagenome]